MFAVAALQTTRSAPALQSERSELISRVQDAERDQDELRSRAAELTAEIDTLRAAALGDDEQRPGARGPDRRPGSGGGQRRGHRTRACSSWSTTRPAASSDARDRVLDLDLQVLANGLWQAGAEAVAINGHRLSGLTAIRSAGDAITVDYRSLTRPYRVEAIGDPRTLPARFVESPAGVWWNELAQNRRMGYEISDVKDRGLAADPGLVLRYAKRPN